MDTRLLEMFFAFSWSNCCRSAETERDWISKLIDVFSFVDDKESEDNLFFGYFGNGHLFVSVEHWCHCCLSEVRLFFCFARKLFSAGVADKSSFYESSICKLPC